MSLTPGQIAARRSGIGGSDAAAICGKHPSKRPIHVYQSKVLGIETVSNERIEWGNELEPIIRRKAAERLGLKIDEPKETFKHPAHPWMLANLDGVCSDGALFEAKNLDLAQSGRLGPIGSDFVLPEHFIQVQHYMEVRDADLTHVAYLVGGNNLRLYDVPRDREIGRALIEIEGEFWHRHVLDEVPPPEDDPEIVKEFLDARYRKSSGKLLPADADSDVERLLARLALARAARRAAERDELVLTNEVKAVIGEDEGIECRFGRVTWKPSKRTAWAAVAREMRAPADLIARHTSTSRRFLPRFEGEADAASEE